MLRYDDNEAICRVEGEAIMGQMLRRNYWIPAAISDVIVAGGAPQRIRLLGSNFVVWRADDGRVAMFDEGCPHRRVSLTLARNEDNALRCIFHGWKFGVDGVVKEVPTEPEFAEEFCKKVPLKHYPVREGGGVIWAWLGGGDPPELPDFQFLGLPQDNVYVVYQTVAYNWVQSIEGGMDAAHVTVLHQDWLGPLSGGGVLAAATGKLAPVYEIEERPYGFRYAAIRKLDGDKRHIRINEFAAPWYCFIAAETGPEGNRTLNMSVPVDDYNCVYWTVRYNPYKKLSPSVFNPVEARTSWPPNPPGSPEENWGQDRDAMRRNSFSGFKFPTTEDFAVAASQGRIASRDQEFLGTSDRAVMKVRRILLEAAREHEKGLVPSIVASNTPLKVVKPMSDIIAKEADWRKIDA